MKRVKFKKFLEEKFMDEELEKLNFLFFIKRASFYELMKFRESNVEKFNELYEKYKDDISKLPLKSSVTMRLTLENGSKFL